MQLSFNQSLRSDAGVHTASASARAALSPIWFPPSHSSRSTHDCVRSAGATCAAPESSMPTPSIHSFESVALEIRLSAMAALPVLRASNRRKKLARRACRRVHIQKCRRVHMQKCRRVHMQKCGVDWGPTTCECAARKKL
eukprot:6204480-Pleurochrysis_carterae.AAC.1